jgi:hypothetical protein
MDGEYPIPALFPNRLTTKENSSQGTFSPDNKQIAFVEQSTTNHRYFYYPWVGSKPVCKLTKYRYGRWDLRNGAPMGNNLFFLQLFP